jgi:hypothetical protein
LVDVPFEFEWIFGLGGWLVFLRRINTDHPRDFSRRVMLYYQVREELVATANAKDGEASIQHRREKAFWRDATFRRVQVVGRAAYDDPQRFYSREIRGRKNRIPNILGRACSLNRDGANHGRDVLGTHGSNKFHDRSRAAVENQDRPHG